ncbi:MAG: radical SAM protein [Actinobacteria bacterium]|nr:radical SAM protein [Actinomycetota bacterium]
MRWDEQRVENDLRLPGVGDGTVVRTFDAPEAMGVNFHEVRARSALNHVPGDRFGFSWTVNPYRGCTHACAYCAVGETQVLMADGTSRSLAEVAVGDEIYGTVRRGRYRRYFVTRVEAHWETRKEAFRVTLEDGTELVASGDHRFLTDRGWKHVVGAERGRGQRPFLTLNNKLLGMGSLGPAGRQTEEYRRGYLCGMIRGDGHLGTYSYPRPGRRSCEVHRFRLALADDEALQRSKRFLVAAGVQTTEFELQRENGRRRRIGAIRASSRDAIERVGDLIRWPTAPGEDWTRGFLAGIFDAEGSCSGALRIANRDAEIVGRTAEALGRFGFPYVVEPPQRNGVRHIRLLGGLRQNMRFFQRADPAISRKRTIDGVGIKSDAKLGVVAIEPLGRELEMYDITTGTGDFIADGVVSHNCFARRTHTYLDFDAGRDFEREIVVKVNVPELLRRELERSSWRRELVALGTNTDPYQWVESRYRMMPEILAALEATRTPVSVLTKSPLVMRDVELFERMRDAGLRVSVNLSVPTLDEAVWRATEPHTPSPGARLDAVAELRRRGIDSGVLVAPLMPGINDSPEQVEPLVARAREAGATFLGGVALHLRDEVKDVFYGWLAAKRPDLLPKYESLYGSRAQMRPEQRKHATRAVKGWGSAKMRSSRADGSSPSDGSSRAPAPSSSASSESVPRAGGAVGGTTPEEALATAGGGGSPAATGPARQETLF